MIAALQERLVAAQGDRFLDLLVEDFARQHIGIGVAGLAVEAQKSQTAAQTLV